MKKIIGIIGVFILFLWTSCTTNNNKTYRKNLTVSGIVVDRTVKLPLPKKTFPSDRHNWFQILKKDNEEFLIAYFYPRPYLYVFNLNTRKQTDKIPICPKKGGEGLLNFYYVNDDSIWIMNGNGPRYNYDSSLCVINRKGIIKHIYPFYHPYFVTTQTYPYLYNDTFTGFDETAFDTILFVFTRLSRKHLVTNNKVFFATMAGNYGRKKYPKHLPIVGCYDLKKDTVVLNKNVFFYGFSDTLFYPESFYYPSITMSHRHTLLISYGYTHAVTELFTNKDSVVIHKRFQSPLIDTIKPFLHPTSDQSDLPIYYGLYYASNIYKYIRFVRLSSKRKEIRFMLFADTNFNYLGEAVLDNEYIPDYIYGNDFVNIRFFSRDSMIVRFFRFQFDTLDYDPVKHYVDSIMQNSNAENCNITSPENNNVIPAGNILEYLEEKFSIADSSFSIIILNKNGCGGCNEYVAKMIALNQNVFFNYKTYPFYLLFVTAGTSHNWANRFMKINGIKYHRHIKVDTTQIYSSYDPFVIKNPRLILVKNRKVVSDTVYMPDNLELLFDRFINFYH